MCMFGYEIRTNTCDHTIIYLYGPLKLFIYSRYQRLNRIQLPQPALWDKMKAVVVKSRQTSK